MSTETVAVILAGIAVAISGVTILAILVLLGRKEFPYPPGQEMEQVPGKLAKLAENQSILWRALEDMDDRLDDAGLSVLRPAVPDDQVQAGKRPVR